MTALYGPAFIPGSSVGPFEVLLVLAAVLILFGPKRLPEVARNLGRMLSSFKRASDDLKGQVMRLDHDLEPEDQPRMTGARPLVVKQGVNSSPRLPVTAVPPLADAPASPPVTEPGSDVKPDAGDPA